MFKSLKSWLDIPVTIKPFIKRNGDGSKVYGTSREELCYIEDKVEVIKNSMGVDVVSNTRLYFDGNISIDSLDVIILNGKERHIENIASFYRAGVVDIKVVYL